MVEFKKYSKIYAIGHHECSDIFKDQNDLIIVEEKIDGGQFRFIIKDGQVYFGSRNQELDLEAKDTKSFKVCVDFVNERLKSCSEETLKSMEGFIFYGECCVSHTLQYDWDKIPRFLGYDVFDTVTGKYLANKDTYFERLNLPTVPLVKAMFVKDIGTINDDMVPDSQWCVPDSKDKKAEGIVFKNYNKQIFAKYVRDKFKEANSLTFGGSPKLNKVDDTDNSEFIFKYCTNPRIDKMIFKLIDEGNKLDMKLMSQLPKRIYGDIWEENWKEISDQRWKLDLDGLRKKIPERCRHVLQQVIANNELNRK